MDGLLRLSGFLLFEYCCFYDLEIADIAKDFGADVPFIRPDSLLMITLTTPVVCPFTLVSRSRHYFSVSVLPLCLRLLLTLLIFAMALIF